MNAQHHTYLRSTNRVDEQVLTFMVERIRCGVNILQVCELRRFTPPTRVPHSSDAVVGIINVRGVVIPVVDLRTMLGMDPIPHTRTSVVILLNVKKKDDEKIVGLIVEQVSDVLDIPNADRAAPPECSDKNVVESVYSSEDEMLIILKINTMLADI